MTRCGHQGLLVLCVSLVCCYCLVLPPTAQIPGSSGDQYSEHRLPPSCNSALLHDIGITVTGAANDDSRLAPRERGVCRGDGPANEAVGPNQRPSRTTFRFPAAVTAVARRLPR
ncbi:hypothetical protein MRX96_039781 [Rhipicephalus microplus]